MDFEEFRVGDHIWFDRTFSAADFAAFAKFSGDNNPLHHDRAFGATSSFGNIIVPLHIAAAPLSFVAGMVFPGDSSLYLGHTLRAVKAVMYDVPVVYSARITDISAARRVLSVRVLGLQNGDVVLDGTLQIQSLPQAGKGSAPAAQVRRAAEQNRVVVTGAGGEIGRVTAVRLAQGGADVVLLARRMTPELQAALEACKKAGVRAEALLGDLSDAKDRARLCEALAKWDDIQALVHAASPAVMSPLETHVAVNFQALVDLTKAVLPGFLRRQKGRVIAIGSSSVETAIAGWEAYSGAKAMVSQFVHAFDRKHRTYGVTGQVIAPSQVDTAMSKALVAPSAATLLIPEEVAQCVADNLGDLDDTTYVSLSPAGTRRAYYGSFVSSGAAEHARTPAKSAVTAQADSAAPGADASLDRIIRGVLGLPASVPLENGGLGLTQGWDSLKQIEIMLAVERAYGVTFAAAEIDQLTTYAGLKRAVDAKR